MLIGAVVPAFCTSPREVLLGLDNGRRHALETALGVHEDVPRTDEWIRLNLRWFDEWHDSPSTAGVDWRGRLPSVPSFLKPLGWVGLGSLRDRIAFCAERVWG
jgi:hypothetical protein